MWFEVEKYSISPIIPKHSLHTCAHKHIHDNKAGSRYHDKDSYHFNIWKIDNGPYLVLTVTHETSKPEQRFSTVPALHVCYVTMEMLYQFHTYVVSPWRYYTSFTLYQLHKCVTLPWRWNLEKKQLIVVRNTVKKQGFFFNCLGKKNSKYCNIFGHTHTEFEGVLMHRMKQDLYNIR